MLSTKIDNKIVTVDNIEKFVIDIVSGKVDKKKARNKYNSTANDANII